MFMVSSSSNLINNLSEGIQKTKCKLGQDYGKCQTCRIKCKYCGCFLEYANFKDNLIDYQFLCCNKIINKSLIEN